jgi:hypothetical protein
MIDEGRAKTASRMSFPWTAPPPLGGIVSKIGLCEKKAEIPAHNGASPPGKRRTAPKSGVVGPKGSHWSPKRPRVGTRWEFPGIYSSQYIVQLAVQPVEEGSSTPTASRPPPTQIHSWLNVRLLPVDSWG